MESEDGSRRLQVETRNRVARVLGIRALGEGIRRKMSSPGDEFSGDGTRGTLSSSTRTSPRRRPRLFLRPPADDGAFVPAERDWAGTGTRGKGGMARGGVPGAVGGTGASPPGRSTALVKCFAAGLGIGMALRRAGGRAPARGERVRTKVQRPLASTLRQARGKRMPSVRPVVVIRSCPAVRSPSFSRMSTVGRDCTTRRPPPVAGIFRARRSRAHAARRLAARVTRRSRLPARTPGDVGAPRTSAASDCSRAARWRRGDVGRLRAPRSHRPPWRVPRAPPPPPPAPRANDMTARAPRGPPRARPRARLRVSPRSPPARARSARPRPAAFLASRAAVRSRRRSLVAGGAERRARRRRPPPSTTSTSPTSSRSGSTSSRRRP